MLLTANSFGFLAQLIMAALITAYLLRVGRGLREPGGRNVTLAALFAALTAFALASFLESALPPAAGLIPLALTGPLGGAALALLIRFGYAFPALDPRHRRERRAVGLLAALCTLGEGAFAAWRLAMLPTGVVTFRPLWADYWLGAGFIWAVAVFLRRCVEHERGRGAWAALGRPLSLAGRTARGFALVCLVWSLVLGLRILLTASSRLHTPVELLTAAAGLLSLFVAALIYLNYLPETTTLLARLVGVTLLTVLLALGAMGWAFTTGYLASYRPGYAALAGRTLRLEPRGGGGYLAAPATRPIEPARGGRVLPRLNDPALVPLPFAFPFAGRQWRELYVYEEGMVSFGRRADALAVYYHYGRAPAILALLVDMAPAADVAGSGVFVSGTAERVLISWQAMHSVHDRQRVYSAQLALFPDGAFELRYGGLGAERGDDGDDLRGALRAVGVVTGAGDPPQLTFGAGPATLGPVGAVADYYLERRQAVHGALAPLTLLLLGVIALVLLGLPRFLRATVIRPLDELLEGVGRAEFSLSCRPVPVLFNDEIGFLAAAFNRTVARLRESSAQLLAHQSRLEELVGERTAELAEANRQLRQEVAERREIERTLRAREEELRQANARLQTLAATDAQTGAANRRGFQEVLTAEVRRAARLGQPMALVMLDVDHFKQYNDSFGHPAGDQVLQTVAGILAANVRATDTVARYGGEEFALVLPDTDLAEAAAVAERCRRAIAAHGWELRAVTASFGVAPLAPMMGPKELVLAADRALYRAKDAGRNCVAAGGEPPERSVNPGGSLPSCRAQVEGETV